MLTIWLFMVSLVILKCKLLWDAFRRIIGWDTLVFSLDIRCTSACHEKTAVLEDFFVAACYALHSRGRFALVQLPERFMDSMELAIRYNLQPKKLQWVHASVDKPAWIFLLEMVKNGSYGLEVLPPLIMYNADGTLTEQAKRQMEKD